RACSSQLPTTSTTPSHRRQGAPSKNAKAFLAICQKGLFLLFFRAGIDWSFALAREKHSSFHSAFLHIGQFVSIKLDENNHTQYSVFRSPGLSLFLRFMAKACPIFKCL
ncbi:MAG: hypothetical protein LBT59_04785, partial [Clostridiales bacterium]|nr:hypothetical protein [Clostridiales bacterium]